MPVNRIRVPKPPAVTDSFKSTVPWMPYDSVLCSKYEEGILVNDLSALEQRALWEGIKALDKNLANLLKNDSVFAEIKERFNGSLRLTQPDYERFSKAGLRLLRGER